MLRADIEGSTGWRRSYAGNMAGNHGRIAYFCFAGGGQIGSRHCTTQGDGYVLLFKWLNNGAFQWPRNEQGIRQLDARSFRWLMEGLKIDQLKAIQKGKAKD